jgi:hypothetical protein
MRERWTCPFKHENIRNFTVELSTIRFTSELDSLWFLVPLFTPMYVVCMYVRKYVCVYVCVYACMCVCAYVCKYVCMCTNVCLQTSYIVACVQLCIVCKWARELAIVYAVSRSNSGMYAECGFLNAKINIGRAAFSFRSVSCARVFMRKAHT